MTTLPKGFTLFGLMLTLILTTILLLSATPISSWFYRHNDKSIALKLFHTLHFARAEAIKRNQMVAVCASTNFYTCGDDWSFGYIVFIPNKNARELTILRTEKNSERATIDTNQRVIQFRGDGNSHTPGTFTIGLNGKPLKIVINDSGRVRMGSSI